MILIASYRYTFGSKFVVKRKPPHGLHSKSLLPGGGNVTGRKEIMSLDTLRKGIESTKRKSKKVD